LAWLLDDSRGSHRANESGHVTSRQSRATLSGQK
jgi:hypothetical protein